MFPEIFARVDRFLDILQQFADTYECSFIEPGDFLEDCEPEEAPAAE